MRLHRSLTILILAIGITAKPACAGFFGPDVELLPAPQLSERMRSQALIFNASGSPLNINTKGAAIGGFLVGMILSSAVASGGTVSGNPAQMQQQMQARMDIAQQFNSNIQVVTNKLSAEAAGAEAAELAQRGPLPLLAQSLNEALLTEQVRIVGAEVVASTADSEVLQLQPLVLSLTQKEWKLDFEGFSSDYVLKSALTLELLDKTADKILLRNTCLREYPKKMPLEDWERDEHLAIAKAAEEIARGCHEEFAKSLSIAPAETNVPPAPLAEAAIVTDIANTESKAEPVTTE